MIRRSPHGSPFRELEAKVEETLLSLFVSFEMAIVDTHKSRGPSSPLSQPRAQGFPYLPRWGCCVFYLLIGS